MAEKFLVFSMIFLLAFSFLTMVSFSQTISLSVMPMKAEIWLDVSKQESVGLVVRLGNDNGDVDAIYTFHLEPDISPYVHSKCISDEIWCKGREVIVPAYTSLHNEPVKIVFLFKPHGSEHVDMQSAIYAYIRPSVEVEHSGNLNIEPRAKIKIDLHQRRLQLESDETSSDSQRNIWSDIVNFIFRRDSSSSSKQSSINSSTVITDYSTTTTIDDYPSAQTSTTSTTMSIEQSKQSEQPIESSVGILKSPYFYIVISGLLLALVGSYIWLKDKFPALFLIMIVSFSLMIVQARADDVSVSVDVVEPTPPLPLSAFAIPLVISSLAISAMTFLPMQFIEEHMTLVKLIKAFIIVILIVVFLSAVSSL